MANAVEHNASFLRVPNAHLLGVGRERSTFSSLRELGLYMMLSAVLSNPSFTYAGGGMQSLLQKHCKNKYFSLHATWKRLSSGGFLQRTRIPVGTNCFHDYYILSGTRAFVGNATVHLSAAEGKVFLDTYGPYLPPHTDFTMVSRDMLMDERLSLAAKGLYALLVRQMRLAAQCSPENSPEISKRALRTLCGEGKNAFDALFRELRTVGYLQLIRTHEGGKLSYVYQLSGAPAVQSVSNTSQSRPKTPQMQPKEPLFRAPRTRMHPDMQSATAGPPMSVNRIWDARAQIEYDILLCDYKQSRLDLIVSIIENAYKESLCNRQKIVSLGRESTTVVDLAERLCSLDSEDIRYVLDTLSKTEKTTKIHNMRRYMTACLYFAKENLLLELDAFSFPRTLSKPVFSG